MDADSFLSKLQKEVNKKGFDPIQDYGDDHEINSVYYSSEFEGFTEDDFIQWLTEHFEHKDGFKKETEHYEKVAKKTWDKLNKEEDKPIEGIIWKTALKDYIDSAFDSFGDRFFRNATFQNNKLVIYRCIAVEDTKEFISNLKKGTDLGEYWSWDRSGAECHWGYGKGKPIIITALASLPSIELDNTAYKNLNPALGEDEREIELKANKPITVIRVESEEGDVLFSGKKRAMASNITKEFNLTNAKLNRTLIAALKQIVFATDHKTVGKTKTWYHLTDRENFELDSDFEPQDNTFSIENRSGQKGIYLAPEIEHWVQGKGYWRPFVVEFDVDPSVKNGPGVHGRWGGEMFIPTSSFEKIEVKRVIPIDAYIREKYGDFGYVERALEQEFDTGKTIELGDWGNPINPPRGYKYTGLDVRDLSSSQTRDLVRQLEDALNTGAL